MNWATVYSDEKNGGLGVKRLEAMDKPLLGKWIWCFANERESLWRKFICGKFGEDGLLGT